LCDVGRVAVKHCFRLLSFSHLLVVVGLAFGLGLGLGGIINDN